MNYSKVLNDSMEHHKAQHNFVAKAWSDGKTAEQTLCDALEYGFRVTKTWIKEEWAELSKELQESRYKAVHV